MFMGTVPTDAPSEFLSTVKPLVMHLLQKCEIGDLRHFFAGVPAPVAPAGKLGSIDFLSVVVSREDVQAGDITSTLRVLQRLLESPAIAMQFFERVDLTFHGYDQVRWELPEIPEVRNFVYKLDEQFPYWLFFSSKRHLGLQCILFCLLPPSLTEEGRARVFPERIADLLERRWFPAMNQICGYVGFSAEQIHDLTDRSLAYITEGRHVGS